jgi:hypothetical protein
VSGVIHLDEWITHRDLGSFITSPTIDDLNTRIRTINAVEHPTDEEWNLFYNCTDASIFPGFYYARYYGKDVQDNPTPFIGEVLVYWTE